MKGESIMTHQLRFMGINRDTETAGPGKRLEFFTKGCIRGVISPCFGCFNESTWTFAGDYREMNTQEIIDICKETSWNRQVTFCGGEPILQAKALAKVAKNLKKIDPTFHFVMYTAYKLDTLMKYGLKFTWLPKYGNEMRESLIQYCESFHVTYKNEEEGFLSINPNDMKKVEFTILSPESVQEVMKHIDLIVDGDYQHKKRLTDSKYMHDGWFVGSSNQRVIFGPASVNTGELKFLQADEYNKQRSENNHCRCCGHDLIPAALFCNSKCAKRYSDRKKEMVLMGGV
jgi:hypothetical protein